MLPGSNQARTIARCGFDWVLVDTEHGNIDGEKTSPPNASPKIMRAIFEKLTSTISRQRYA